MRILSEEGRAQVAFNRHLSLAEGFAASDAVLNSASLVTSMATNSVPSGWRTTTSRTNRNGAVAGSPSATTKRFRIVVQAQPRGGRQRTPNASYLVSGKDMSSPDEVHPRPRRPDRLHHRSDVIARVIATRFTPLLLSRGPSPSLRCRPLSTHLPFNP